MNVTPSWTLGDPVWTEPGGRQGSEVSVGGDHRKATGSQISYLWLQPEHAEQHLQMALKQTCTQMCAHLTLTHSAVAVPNKVAGRLSELFGVCELSRRLL